MVMDSKHRVEVLSALSGSTRLRLMEILDRKELRCEDPEDCGLDERCCDVGELAEKLGVSAPSVSHHLKELRRAGLIETTRQGRHVYCSLNRETFRELGEWFDSYANLEGTECE